MILSHLHKFVFIKGLKVAGTSAEIALSQQCGPDDIITPITPADEHHRIGTSGEPRNYASHLYPRFIRTSLERRYVASLRGASSDALASVRRPRSRFRNHMRLGEVLSLVPEAASYEVIFVERSPYAKVMSLANWQKHAHAYGSGGSLGESPATIAEAVDRVIADGAIRKVVNIDRYRDSGGDIAAKPWSAETLAADLEAFFRSRGLENVPLVHAKRGFRSETVDPATVLRPDQIELINKVFAEEFESFGWPRIH